MCELTLHKSNRDRDEGRQNSKHVDQAVILQII